MPQRFDYSKAFLYCNEHPLPLQPVLSPALRALRASGHTNFGIDSVCVNKDDPADQKHHPTLRGRVLQKAHDRLRVQRQMFHYSELDVAKNQTRLLRIVTSGSAESLLVIEVIPASLDDKPDYIAPSDVWGSNDRNYDLPCVGGSTIPITDNLYLTLCELRQNSFGVVWADQICINQLDRQELGQQVSIMSRIYRQARIVVVSLGTTLCNNPNRTAPPPVKPSATKAARLANPQAHPITDTESLLAVRPDRPSFKLSEFIEMVRFRKVWSMVT